MMNIENAVSKFWQDPETTHALMARLPEYRLSKFQRALPEKAALELVGRYLLDVEAAEWFVFSEGEKE